MDRAKIGRASKARAKTYERDVAKALGGKRFPADTGGKLDVLAEPFGVQVKSGGNVVTEVIRQGMAEAVEGCQGTALTPLLAVVDRRGTRNQTYIVMRLSDWLDHHGKPPTPPLQPTRTITGSTKDWCTFIIESVDENTNSGVE